LPTYRLHDTMGDDLGLLELQRRTSSQVTSSLSQTGEKHLSLRVE
jgi:hypothetical protein